MSTLLKLPELQDEARLVRLAREVATDLYSIETILERYQISPEEWAKLSKTPRFATLLNNEIAAWGSALNTHERTKLKASAMIEEWLPEAYARLSDAKENLAAKNELAKLIARLAGMGMSQAEVQGGGGERFQVTINLGADSQLKFEKTVTSKVIDAEPL